jgi:hypothetical protein
MERQSVHKRTAARILGVTFLSFAMLAGCGQKSANSGNVMTGNSAMKPTITLADANKRVEDYTQQMLKAVFPEAHAELGFQEVDGDCSDPSDGGPPNRRSAARGYQITGIDPATYPAKFDAVQTWWKSNGFAVSTDKNNASGRLLGAETPDGFGISVQSNDSGGLSITTGSPCVWRNGTPEPPS